MIDWYHDFISDWQTLTLLGKLIVIYGSVTIATLAFFEDDFELPNIFEEQK